MRDIAASSARRGIAAYAPPQPRLFQFRLRRKGDLVAPGLDGLWAGLITLGLAYFRKAKFRGRVGQRSNDELDAGAKTIYAGRAGNTTGISK